MEMVKVVDQFEEEGVLPRDMTEERATQKGELHLKERGDNSMRQKAKVKWAKRGMKIPPTSIMWRREGGTRI